MRNLLYILIILSFVLAGLSPACKFISGQTQQIEICSYDGIKTVTIADKQVPDNRDHEHKSSQDCAFCFAQSNLKLMKAIPPAFTLFKQHSLESILTLTVLDLTRYETAASPRGPPALYS
jgi:hypothetical protein